MVVLVMMRLKNIFYTAVSLNFFALLLSLIHSASADTLWNHNNSTMRVVQTNNSIEIYYEYPRKDLQERGVEKGTLLYRGTIMNGLISGLAQSFPGGCKNSIGYDASGKFTSENLISLRGMRPLVNDCQPISRYAEESLSFFYISKADEKKSNDIESKNKSNYKASLQSDSVNKIKLTKIGGVYAVPLALNGAVTLYGIVDSGASDVSIPFDIIKAMKEDQIISDKDFIDEKNYIMADGSKVAAKRYLIKSVKVGEKEIKNVTISSTSKNGVILLGQSFLSRFKTWSIDNESHSLLLD